MLAQAAISKLYCAAPLFQIELPDLVEHPTFRQLQSDTYSQCSCYAFINAFDGRFIGGHHKMAKQKTNSM